ncbi:MAG TPA: fused MFS/spermidine synthase [Gemmatimonadaceae bacterium]
MIALFAAAALTGAFLLFWVEPLFARLVLPLLGGAPAVWNTCLMFFQTLLLLGYLYAHLSTRYLTAKRQVILHIALLLLCLIVMPIAIPGGWTPPASGNVIPWLVGTLSVTVGLPFLVLSATAPLLQKWLAGLDKPVENPYVLYAASNAGSFLGLLAFPLLLEPALTLKEQSRLWLVIFLVAIALLGLCGAVAWRQTSTVRTPGARDTAANISWLERLRWIALAFVPSSLLLSVTTYLSTDIAATPLLWVIPLSLYLLTFVIVFARSGQKLAIGAEITHTLLITILAYVLFRHTSLGFRVGYLFHLALFTVTALVLHGELAASRPAPARLTEYYLWISLGGALGGIFAAIVVPLVFKSTRDYTLMLVAGMLLRMAFRNNKAHNQLPLVAIPALLLAAAGLFGKSRETIFTDRSFFGIYRVTLNAGPTHILYHGSTIHGAQFLNRPPTPVTYYHPNGPVGAVFRTLQTDRTARNVGVVGLGTGSILCYAKAGEHWTFFEIDAHVERIARNPRLFSFLSQCAAKPTVVLGDARLTLAREPAGRYSLLVLDAFSSDAIPVHLMTREAMHLYDQVLEEHGLLMVHISNRRLDLEPVVGRLADDIGMFAIVRDDDVPNDRQDKDYEYSSTWVVLSKHKEDIDALAADKRWRPLREAPPDKTWTDDYSNILSVIKW